jgi:hypothetical protein
VGVGCSIPGTAEPPVRKPGATHRGAASASGEGESNLHSTFFMNRARLSSIAEGEFIHTARSGALWLTGGHRAGIKPGISGTSGKSSRRGGALLRTRMWMSRPPSIRFRARMEQSGKHRPACYEECAMSETSMSRYSSARLWTRSCPPLPPPQSAVQGSHAPARLPRGVPRVGRPFPSDIPRLCATLNNCGALAGVACN